MVAVKRLSEAVGDIFLRRKAFRRIFRPAFGQYPVSDAALRPGLRQCIEPLAAQLRSQRRRDEPVAAPHFGPAHGKNRIAALHRLRPQCRGIGRGIFSPFQGDAACGRSRHPLTVGIAEPDTPCRRFDQHRGGDHAARTAAGEELVETVVVIAVDLRPGHNTFHAVGRHTVAVGGVDIGACEPPVGEETDAVARGEQTAPIETEPVLFDPHHTAHILAHRLRRIERRHARPLAREEIFRLSAREALGRIGREIRDALPG